MGTEAGGWPEPCLLNSGVPVTHSGTGWFHAQGWAQEEFWQPQVASVFNMPPLPILSFWQLDNMYPQRWAESFKF